MSDIEYAVELYKQRQSRRAHPTGSFDRGGRWYPSEDERRDCCRFIRPPTRRWPFSLLLHCRTATHVAALCGVDESELRRAIRQPTTSPRREGGDHYYKMVAVVDGKYISLYDAQTEYVLGQTMIEPARQHHRGGYYVYASVNEAKRADVVPDPDVIDAPRAILRVRAEGAYCRYANGKLAFSRITPLEAIRL